MIICTIFAWPNPRTSGDFLKKLRVTVRFCIEIFEGTLIWNVRMFFRTAPEIGFYSLFFFFFFFFFLSGTSNPKLNCVHSEIPNIFDRNGQF